MNGKKESSPNSTQLGPQEVIPSYRIKNLLVWRANGRVVKKRSKEYWSTVLAIAFLISVILFFAQEYFLIATIFALIFLYYVLSTQAPEEIQYRITNQGIYWGEQKYPWQSLRYFWFDKEDKKTILYLDTQQGFPKRLILPLGSQKEKKARDILEDFLPYHKPKPNFIEKTTDWLVKTFPLDISSSKKK